jgi:Tfp pilus assembly protein PilN
LFKYGSLQKRFNEVKAEQKARPDIRKELSFLQLLESNRSPYLESIHIISRTAPQGAFIERVGMNRRGEVNLEGQVQSPDQLEEFRSSLIKSGFFYPVVVDEQTMDQQKRKLSFRITAKWKPKDARKPLPKEWMKIEENQKSSSSAQSNSRGGRERRRR